MLKLPIIINSEKNDMKKTKLPPIHPGKILLEEFLTPLNISQYRLAKATSVSPRRINEIVLEKRAITADTALRLGVFFDMSPQFWMNLQSRYELEKAEDLLAGKIKKEVHKYSENLSTNHINSR